MLKSQEFNSSLSFQKSHFVMILCRQFFKAYSSCPAYVSFYFIGFLSCQCVSGIDVTYGILDFLTVVAAAQNKCPGTCRVRLCQIFDFDPLPVS